MTDYTNAPAIPPVVGKRYVMRNGEVTGVISDTSGTWAMSDDDRDWRRDGYFYDSKNPSSRDIVAPFTADPQKSPADSARPQSAPHDNKTAAWAIMGGYMKRVMKHVEQDDLAHAAQEWRSMVAFAQEAGL